jgi:hypothetical protein
MIKKGRPISSINESERREMIEKYLEGGKTKLEIWQQHTGQDEEHGQILRWMRQLGYSKKKLPSNALSLLSMSRSNKPQPSVEELHQLQQKIKQLEQQLLDSQLKEEAYKRMIEIAEKELKVSIQKKPNTK